MKTAALLRDLPLLALVLLPACAGAAATPAPAVPAEVRQREVTIPGTDVRFSLTLVPEGPFWIGTHEVTWDEYLAWCRFDERLPAEVDALSRPSKPLDVHPYDRNWGAGRRPAVGMSRDAARLYCAWLSERTGLPFRLPTEDEWRLAAGPRPADVEAHAWVAGNSGARTQPVGTRRPNARGLHDVYGNLWEYCEGGWSATQPDRAVLRGGSWREPADELALDARLRFDDDWTLDDPGFPPGVWWVPDGDHLGFRLLLPLAELP